MQRAKKIIHEIDILKKSTKMCSTHSEELLLKNTHDAEARHEKIVEDYYKAIEEASRRRESSLNNWKEMSKITNYCSMSDTHLKIIAKRLDKSLRKTANEIEPLLKNISSLNNMPAEMREETKNLFSSPEYKAAVDVS